MFSGIDEGGNPIDAVLDAWLSRTDYLDEQRAQNLVYATELINFAETGETLLDNSYSPKTGGFEEYSMDSRQVRSRLENFIEDGNSVGGNLSPKIVLASPEYADMTAVLPDQVGSSLSDGSGSEETVNERISEIYLVLETYDFLDESGLDYDRLQRWIRDRPEFRRPQSQEFKIEEVLEQPGSVSELFP